MSDITDTPTPPAAKPGWQTTEFWLSSAATLLGILMASGAIEAGSTWDKVVGLLITVLAALGYTVARAAVKRASGLILIAALATGLSGCAVGNARVALAFFAPVQADNSGQTGQATDRAGTLQSTNSVINSDSVAGTVTFDRQIGDVTPTVTPTTTTTTTDSSTSTTDDSVDVQAGINPQLPALKK